MKVTIQYLDDVEKESIIADQLLKGSFLVEQQNVTEGNFLVFDDEQPIGNRIDGLQTDNMIVMMSLADIYAEIQTLKGGA
ncbi:hypothetical protein [Sporosarcina sp. SAFN-010]|uniref:hypothetical protein n=1 Tax=Sporosarcina sp. SAFN-010 TaxID=3387273 RepID=UPI003F7CD82D